MSVNSQDRFSWPHMRKYIDSEGAAGRSDPRAAIPRPFGGHDAQRHRLVDGAPPRVHRRGRSAASRPARPAVAGRTPSTGQTGPDEKAGQRAERRVIGQEVGDEPAERHPRRRTRTRLPCSTVKRFEGAGRRNGTGGATGRSTVGEGSSGRASSAARAPRVIRSRHHGSATAARSSSCTIAEVGATIRVSAARPHRQFAAQFRGPAADERAELHVPAGCGRATASPRGGKD